MQNTLFLLCCGAACLLTVYVLYRSVFSIRTDFGFSLDKGLVSTQTCLAAFAVLLGALTYVFLLVSLYRFLQRHHRSERALLVCGIGVFALFCAAYFLVAQNLSLLPYYDLSYLMSEAELLLRDGVLRPKAHAYFSVYPPTYFPMLMLYYSYRVFSAFGTLDIFMVGNALSTVLMGVAVWLGFCTARRLWGIKMALVYLAAVVSNPIFYLMASWCYTDTMSMPFCMAVIYAFVRGMQSARARGAFGWLVLAGACGMMGTKLRATSCILLLAVGAWAFADPTVLLRKKLAVLGGMALGAGLGLAGVQAILHTIPFLPDANLTLPTTHWLMMGLNEKSAGYWLETDFDFSTGIAGAAAKKAAIWSELTARVRGLGLWGLLSLWSEKLAVTFSSGYCLHAVDMVRQYDTLYQYSFGNSSLFVQYGCQFARSGLFALLAVSVASAARAGRDKRLVRKENTASTQSTKAAGGAGELFSVAGATPCAGGAQELPAATRSALRMLCIALLGTFAFYLLWEAKPRYSYPFLLWFSLLSLSALPRLSRALEGVVTVAHAGAAQRSYPVVQLVRRSGIVITGFTLCLFLLNVRPMAQTLRYYTNPVAQQMATRETDGVPITSGAPLMQTFQVSDTFNEIWISLFVGEQAKSDDAYMIRFESEHKNLTYEQTFTVADIEFNVLKVRLDPVKAYPNANYSVTIAPVSADSRGLMLNVHDYYDLYREGVFSINGQRMENIDASFRVLQTSPRSITTTPIFFTGMALCLLAQLAAFTDFFHTRREKPVR